jgi:hypothetical protein
MSSMLAWLHNETVSKNKLYIYIYIYIKDEQTSLIGRNVHNFNLCFQEYLC